MSTHTDYLNSAQKKAVAHTDGPLLVVAGAGTGKTKVIVERIARLVKAGIDKKSILALTFTEKAAQEMLDRVGELLEVSYGVELNIFTFNSFGQELLREFALEIGQSSNMQLIGDTGKVVLLREHLDRLGLDYFAPISAPDRQLGDLSSYFSKLKQQLVQPDVYIKYAAKLPHNNDEETLEKQRHSELAQAFKTYIELTRSRNIIDYDDQLYLLVELLEKRPNILKKLQERYQYILVDEFQDTNPMQSRLLDLLAAKHQNIMVVGDDDQSIYGWRGATLANILEFKNRYTQAKEIALIENFRSTQEILDSAYAMIQYNNPDRLEIINNLNKKLIAQRGTGQMPSICAFSHLNAELSWVAIDIQKRIDDGAEPGSIAVLARRNDGVRRAHQALEAQGIEHAVAGISNDMYKQPIIATLIEALKVATDPHDDQALYHTLTGALFKLNPQELGTIAATARRTHQNLEQLIADVDDQSYMQALATIRSWRSIVHEVTVGTLAYKIIDETGLKNELYTQAQDNESVALTVQALGMWFVSLRDFEHVSDIASTSSYIQNLEALKAEGEMIADDTVDILNTLPVVMSVHKAKGLEWDTVYIIDCTENTFPLRRFGGSLEVPKELSQTTSADDHYNEERRLMYVAATRAKNQLILTHSKNHNGVTPRKPSRFIEEMFGKVSTELVDQASQQTSLDLFNPTYRSEAKTAFPSSLLSGDKLVLTASQAYDYMRCPLDFRYRHILQVPPAPDPTRTVGTLFHTIIQNINDAKLNKKPYPKLIELQAELQKAWPTEGYISATQRKRALESAIHSLKHLHKRLKEDQQIPLSVEEGFRVHIPESHLILKGRIDVVLPFEDSVEIRDYKTSTNAHSAEKARKSAQASKQLEMYALAWRLKHGEMPARVSLDFVQTGHIGQVKKHERTIDNLQNKLAKVAQEILQGSFEPGRDHRYCQHPLDMS